MTAPEMHPMTNCPADEVLAAYTDGNLRGKERDEVTEHVASCPDCRFRVMIASDFAAAEENVVRGRFGWRLWAGAAAMAAITLIVFNVFFRQRDPFPELIAAANQLEERPIAARLSGDFAYKEHRPKRSGGDAGDSLEKKYPLYGVADDIAGRAEKSPTPRNLHAAGVLFTLLGGDQKAHAIELLEKAAAADPQNADLQVDLAAAYLARGTDADAARALAAAQKAWSIKKTPAALWNIATALDTLGRYEEAEAKWKEYLGVDPNSPWAQEVRDRLDLR